MDLRFIGFWFTILLQYVLNESLLMQVPKCYGTVIYKFCEHFLKAITCYEIGYVFCNIYQVYFKELPWNLLMILIWRTKNWSATSCCNLYRHVTIEMIALILCLPVLGMCTYSHTIIVIFHEKAWLRRHLFLRTGLLSESQVEMRILTTGF